MRKNGLDDDEKYEGSYFLCGKSAAKHTATRQTQRKKLASYCEGVNDGFNDDKEVTDTTEVSERSCA